MRKIDEVGVNRIEGNTDSEFRPTIDFLTKNQDPEGMKREEKSVFLHQMAPCRMVQGVLFKMDADEVLQRYVEKDKMKVIRALHSGLSRGHLAAVPTIGRIRKAGYWWPKLVRDVKEFVTACNQC